MVKAGMTIANIVPLEYFQKCNIQSDVQRQLDPYLAFLPAIEVESTLVARPSCCKTTHA